MAFQLLLAPQPETNNTSPEDARHYLGEFVGWLQDFFIQIGQNTNEIDQVTGNTLFEMEQIAFFPEALSEVQRDQHFNRLQNLVAEASVGAISQHGLYGAQLRWKLSNINFHFVRFIEQRSASLLDRLLSSIDTLLDSLLDAVPGGSAVKELKEAVQDSLALASN